MAAPLQAAIKNSIAGKLASLMVGCINYHLHSDNLGMNLLGALKREQYLSFESRLLGSQAMKVVAAGTCCRCMAQHLLTQQSACTGELNMVP